MMDREDLTSRAGLYSLGAALDPAFPHLTFGSRVFGGAEEWRRAIFGAPPMTPGERHRAFRALAEPLLTATDAGRARLEAWTAAHPNGAAWTLGPVALREHIRDRLLFVGDIAVLDPITDALTCAPAPVRDAVLAEVVIFSRGASTNGWLGPARVLARPGAPPPQSIMLIAGHRSAAEIRRTTLHECAHLWHARRTDLSTLVPSVNETRVLAIAREEKWPALAGHERRVARDELLADALAALWGASA
jgi:hypothetical protein